MRARGANGLRVIACGQTAVARRDGLLDGRLQTRDRATEQRELKAQRKPADGPYLAQGVVVSGVRSATILLATEAQGIHRAPKLTKMKPVRFLPCGQFLANGA